MKNRYVSSLIFSRREVEDSPVKDAPILTQDTVILRRFYGRSKNKSIFENLFDRRDFEDGKIKESEIRRVETDALIDTGAYGFNASRYG